MAEAAKQDNGNNSVDDVEFDVQFPVDELLMEDVCEKLDEFTFRALELIQEYMDLSLKCEAQQKDGFLNLAKSRFIQGSNSVSKIQLPTRDSEEYSAIITISSVNICPSNEDNKISFDKDTSKYVNWNMDVSADIEDNLKLNKQFGVIPTNSIKVARESFRKSLQLHVDRINVAQELEYVQREFILYSKFKKELIKDKELKNKTIKTKPPSP